MAVEPAQRLVQDVERVEVGRGRVEVADLEGLGDAALVVSLVGVAEEDVGFPCLGRSSIACQFLRLWHSERRISTVAWERRRTKTHPQKPRILALLDALLAELQRLLQVLPVNGILDLLVAPVEDGVAGGGHDPSYKYKYKKAKPKKAPSQQKQLQPQQPTIRGGAGRGKCCAAHSTAHACGEERNRRWREMFDGQRKRKGVMSV